MRTSIQCMLSFALLMLLGGAAKASFESGASSSTLIEGSYIVTFKRGTAAQASLIEPPVARALRLGAPPAFGEHGTGQSKEALAATLQINGKVASIFESINAAHIRMDSASAARLMTDPRVLRVEQNRTTSAAQTIQTNPGWALDRLDQPTTLLNQQYVYNASGVGQTIYILDSGLNLGNPLVAAEFGGRASVLWDVNGAGGIDCHGHGTQVASAAAGNTFGVAKAASVVIAKISIGCTNTSDTATWAQALNWLAVNAPTGTIVNLSQEVTNGPNQCRNPIVVQAVDDAVVAAHDAGIIVVVSAGNDNCDTARFSPTRTPQAFVVGATSNTRLTVGQDARAPYSRFGANVSAFAPGTDVLVMNANGSWSPLSGTSNAAPYIAGLFAVGCQAAQPLCQQMGSSTVAYNALRNLGTIGSVVESNGSPLPSGTPSRFIHRSAW